MMRFLCLISFVSGLLLPFSAPARVYIGEEEVEAAVKKEFVEQGLNEEIDIEMFGGQTSFAIEEADKAKVMVSKLKYDELQNKFSADVEVFADGKLHVGSQLQGKYYVLGEIYVPSRNINKGEIISEADLKSISVRMNRIKPQNVTDFGKLVNKEAKRALKEGKIINDKDISDKKVIRKGETVTSIYKTKYMQITAKCEALSDGSIGEKIEVMNIKSKKTLYGKVIDADTVEVDAQ